jgi:peroxiredoxin
MASHMSVKSRTASVGVSAPAIELVDQHGASWTLSDAVAHGPVVLVFLRGFI